MPSQKQLRWSQLRVGLTVVFAAIVLAFLIFLMSGTIGLFSPTLRLITYAASAGGLRNGAPVRLENVDIGSVEKIRLVHHTEPSGENTPVEIDMKVNAKFRPFLHTDSQVMLATAGVLGETFVDIDSTHATGPMVSNNTVLASREVPDIQDVVASSKTTLENVNVLLGRVNNIVSAIEDQRGSVGKLIYDKQLYNNLNSSVAQVNSILADVNKGQGSLGKLLKDDQLYNRANTAIDKVNTLVENINNGPGTIGKLIHDPALYNNANQTLAKTNTMIDNINHGKGTLGMFASDKQFARKMNLLVSNLSIISGDLNAGRGTAGRLLKDPSLYNNVDNLMVESRGLVKAIRSNPKRYLTIHLKLF